MRATALMPLACLALAACGSSDKIDARNEKPAALAEKVAASGMTPRPGRWQGTFRIEKKFPACRRRPPSR